MLPPLTVLTIPPVPTNLDRLSASVMEATSCRMDSVLVRYTHTPPHPFCRPSSLAVYPWFSDVDECVDNRSLCGDQKCVNTDGGYRCDCYPGYMKDDMGSCIGEKHGNQP